MNILLIPDKFKGSLSANEVIGALKKGIRSSRPNASISSVIASDGGDGFLHAVSENVSCSRVASKTVDALGRAIDTFYLYDSKTETAYIELAEASGIASLDENEKSASMTSTYGTGIQIKQAIEKGAKTVYIGLGGSATNDGGIGIAAAFGYVFFDEAGKELAPIGKHLTQLNSIQGPTDPNRLNNCTIIAVNDVENPLYGKNGAAYTYGKQKGANASEIQVLDKGLKNLHRIVKATFNIDAASISGAGAAGGTGYGLKAFLDADFISGIDFVLNMAGVEGLIKNQKFDYIITGEGKFDDQTLNGKLIKGVVDLGAHFKIPIIAICGQLDIDAQRLKAMDLHGIIEIMDHSKSIAYNMEHAEHLLEQAILAFFNAKKGTV